MKHLDRYLLGIFSASWLIVMAFFTGLFVLIHFFSRMGKLARAAAAFKGAGEGPLQGWVHYYLVNLPFVMVEMLPFAILMAGMWSVQHMSRRNELVPVVTSGVSYKRLCLPLFFMAFLLGLGFSVVKEEVLPGLARERQRMDSLMKGDKLKILKNLPLIDDGTGLRFLISMYDIEKETALGVDILGRDDPGRYLGEISKLVYREQAAPPGWYAAKGAEVSGDLSFPLVTDLLPKDIEVESAALRYLSIKQLKRLIARNPGKLSLRVLQYAHYAYPLAGVILLLLGLPLVLRGQRQSPYVAAGMSLLVSVLYYCVQSVLQDMGSRGQIFDPLLGAWLPVLLFGSLGLIFFETVRT